MASRAPEPAASATAQTLLLEPGRAGCFFGDFLAATGPSRRVVVRVGTGAAWTRSQARILLEQLERVFGWLDANPSFDASWPEESSAIGRLLARWVCVWRAGRARGDNEDAAMLARARLPLSRQDLSPAVLFVDGPCDADCAFCAAKTDAPQPRRALLARLDRPGGGGLLCVVGNEPLASAFIVEAVARARALGFSGVELMTSGLRLADAGLARELVAAGATAFSLPLHALSPEVHDGLVGRPGAWRAARAGLDAALCAGARVFLHATLTRRNAGQLRALERHAARRLRVPFAVLPLRPKTSRAPFPFLAVGWERVRGLGLRSLAAFPLCVGSGGRLSSAMGLYALRGQAFVKPDLCRACAVRIRCPGVFPEQLALFGAAALSPQGGSRAAAKR